MPRRLAFPLFGLALGLFLVACSDDGTPSATQDSGKGTDQGLVYQDLDPSQDQAVPSDGVRPDQAPLRDGTPKTDVTSPHDLSPSRDLPGSLDGSVSCVKGSFIGCQGSVLIRCNAQGKPENISCSPYLCNITHQRCNECDTAHKATCNGAYSVSCGSDGLVAAKSYCKLGCDAKTGLCKGCTQKTYYKDNDKDSYGDPAVALQACTQPPGYVTNKLDCDDNDDRAKPGQTQYFTSPSKGKKSFDYNCDGAATKRWLSIALCLKGCSFEGWDGPIPACGQKKTWVQCRLDPFDHRCDDDPWGDRTQACR